VKRGGDERMVGGLSHYITTQRNSFQLPSVAFLSRPSLAEIINGNFQGRGGIKEGDWGLIATRAVLVGTGLVLVLVGMSSLLVN
jgi:hypothetical protein